jgi:hypothetical protein
MNRPTLPKCQKLTKILVALFLLLSSGTLHVAQLLPVWQRDHVSLLPCRPYWFDHLDPIPPITNIIFPKSPVAVVLDGKTPQSQITEMVR